MSERAVLRRKLQEDETFIKFRRMVKAMTNPEFDNFITEIENLHKGRKSRQLTYNKTPNLKDVIDASMQDSSYRSRIVEIIINVTKQYNLLSTATDAILNYVVSTYRSTLANIRAKGDREQLVKSLIEDAYKKLADFERILEIANYVVEDVDKTAWVLHNTMKGLELIYNKPGAN